MSVGEFSALVESIYDCSFNPSLWPKALTETADYLKCSTARLFLFNNDPQKHGFGSSVGLDRGFNDKFDNDLETLNSVKYGFVVSHLDAPQTLDEILGTNGGRDVNGNAQFDNRYYKDWMVPHGYHDVLAALMVKNEQHFGGLAMTRSLGQPRFTPRDRDNVRLIAPHIRCALKFSDMIDQKVIERNRLAEIIDSLATPVVIIDDCANLVHSNQTALKLIASGEVVLVEQNGPVTAAHAASRDALALALTSGLHMAQSMALRKRRGGDLIASVLPLANISGVASRSASHAAIFFHDPDREFQLPGEALAKLYRLTGAELRLLLALAHGATLNDVAARSGTAITTVRSHLKNLFSKTGKSRQSDLVQMAMMSVSQLR
jgi:DNA-binding CsgD family transcriptional regulator